MMAAAFSDYIRARRLERGLSIREAAARMGVSPSRLGEIERGKTYARERDTLPSKDLLARMAVAYGLPEGILLTAAGYPSPDGAQVSPETEQAISMFEMLSEEGRKLALGLIRVLIEQGH